MKISKIIIAALITTAMMGSMTVFAADDKSQSGFDSSSGMSLGQSPGFTHSDLFSNWSFGTQNSSQESNSIDQGTSLGTSQSGFGFNFSSDLFSSSTLEAFDRSSFMQSFNSFDDFQNKTAFTVSNFGAGLSVSDLNTQFATMSLQLHELGFGQSNALNTEIKLQHSNDIMNTFQKNFGGLDYNSIQIDSGDITEGKMKTPLQMAAEDRNNTYQSCVNSAEYQAVRERTSFTRVYSDSLAGSKSTGASKAPDGVQKKSDEQLKAELNSSWRSQENQDRLASQKTAADDAYSKSEQDAQKGVTNVEGDTVAKAKRDEKYNQNVEQTKSNVKAKKSSDLEERLIKDRENEKAESRYLQERYGTGSSGTGGTR